ncbi:hypothetical protein AS159_06385 [Thermotoga sp. Ku-13t]|uniref:NAD(P)/FAD-dependent oxidoreductase n=1 Tax=Thermotoga sp. Ku-13t TaxID=1755813 RepID=UPI0013EA6808|nr:NAD(P)/FAD-dependent oxidoreductase [Thermotoga sp. Ku-13t]KAF2958011.1 hypothetical protein AS159_06385 [Thermotoga sp. Ku-13t]
MRVGVVGAGPAGVTAAVFLSRYGVEVTIFEKEEVGGLIVNAWRIENLPVFSPCSGEDLAKVLKERLEESRSKLICEEVLSIQGRSVKTVSATYDFDSVIIATGTKPKRIEEFEVNQNVVYEFKRLPRRIKSLAIYGAGDVAFDGALKAKHTGVSEVHIFSRSDRIKAVPRLVRLASHLGVRYHRAEPIQAVEDLGGRVRLFTKAGSYDFDALLICIGRVPNVPAIVKPSREVHVVGDASGSFRQLAIAMGQAVDACMKILQGGWCS